jgi:hypothetical protein
LFGLEQVERDRARVVCFEKLGALVEQAALAGDEPLTIVDVALAEGDDLFGRSRVSWTWP